MAEFKRRTLILSSSKQIRLYGNSIAIGPSLELGEGGAPNIFSQAPNHSVEKNTDKLPPKISNPFQLTAEEIHEMADYNIQLWMNLKGAIRKFGADSAKVFNPE
jgi:hypothetical protein